MSEIRRLTADDVDAVVDVYKNAYPGFVTWTADGLAGTRERALKIIDGPGQEYGLFRTGRLLGIMTLYDFTMNFAGRPLPVGGVGGVAVDFLNKKEHVAKELIEFYLDHFVAQGTFLAALYPFRPDFYRQMGFGYGTRMHEYRVPPAGFPRGAKDKLHYLDESDLDAILACYQRFFQRQHGLFARTTADFTRLWPRPKQQIVGYVDDDVRGYLKFSFESSNDDNFLSNNLIIHELVYDDAAVLRQFLAFLHSQRDQIDRVVYSTQDPDFLHLLDDPRNHHQRVFPIIAHETNVQGAGMMYRVVDLDGLLGQLAEHDFGGQTLTLALELEDSFRPANNRRHLLRFDAGHVDRGDGAADVSLRLNVSAFSSLLVGAVGLPALLRLGLAELSNPDYQDALAQLFYRPAAPICLTPF